VCYAGTAVAPSRIPYPRGACWPVGLVGTGFPVPVGAAGAHPVASTVKTVATTATASASFRIPLLGFFGLIDCAFRLPIRTRSPEISTAPNVIVIARHAASRRSTPAGRLGSPMRSNEINLQCRSRASNVGARASSRACRSSQHPQRGLIQTDPPLWVGSYYRRSLLLIREDRHDASFQASFRASFRAPFPCEPGRRRSMVRPALRCRVATRSAREGRRDVLGKLRRNLRSHRWPDPARALGLH
jgi:hypothetical protein